MTTPTGASTAPAVLDVDRAMRLLGLGPEEFEVVFAAAMGELLSRLSRARDAACAGRLDEVALHAHTVKSTAGTVGAERLRLASVSLLSAARAGDLSGSVSGCALALQAYEDLRLAAYRS